MSECAVSYFQSIEFDGPLSAVGFFVAGCDGWQDFSQLVILYAVPGTLPS